MGCGDFALNGRLLRRVCTAGSHGSALPASGLAGEGSGAGERATRLAWRTSSAAAAGWPSGLPRSWRCRISCALRCRTTRQPARRTFSRKVPRLQPFPEASCIVAAALVHGLIGEQGEQEKGFVLRPPLRFRGRVGPLDRLAGILALRPRRGRQLRPQRALQFAEGVLRNFPRTRYRARSSSAPTSSRARLVINQKWRGNNSRSEKITTRATRRLQFQFPAWYSCS